MCVVNTCTVTAEADREALALLRRVTRRNPAARLVVTGCLATRDPELVKGAAPHAVLVGNDAKASIPAMFGCSPAPPEAALPSVSGRSRAFLKVQDGCNMDCAYCTIPSIRPALSVVPLPELLESVSALAAPACPRSCCAASGWAGTCGGRRKERASISAALSRACSTCRGTFGSGCRRSKSPTRRIGCSR